MYFRTFIACSSAFAFFCVGPTWTKAQDIRPVNEMDLKVLALARQHAAEAVESTLRIERFVLQEDSVLSVTSLATANQQKERAIRLVIQAGGERVENSSRIQVLAEEIGTQSETPAEALLLAKGFFPNPDVVLKGLDYTPPTRIEHTRDRLTLVVNIAGNIPSVRGTARITLDVPTSRIVDYRLFKNGTEWMHVSYEYDDTDTSVPALVRVIQRRPNPQAAIAFVSFWHHNTNH